ncbi:hypothetical protein B566_EDAN007156 [Ephemera danica]|nr:hypothetical protein B566_EDAN007156 [Ephemera danica]
MLPVKKEIISAGENEGEYTNALINESFFPCKNEFQDTPVKRSEEKRKYNTQKLRHAELSSPKIPRPPNSFMLFAQEHRKGLSKINPNLKNKDISKLLGQAWKRISDAERNAYDKIAQEAAAEHKRRYPTYVYIPKEARIRKAQRDQLKQALKAHRKQMKNLKSQSSSDKENCSSSVTSPPSPNSLPNLFRQTRDGMLHMQGMQKFPAMATSTPLASSHNEMMHMNMGQQCSFGVPSMPFSPNNTYRDTTQLHSSLPNFHGFIHSGQSNLQIPQQDNGGYITHQAPSQDSKNFMWYPGANFYNYSSAAPWIYPEQHSHQGLRLPAEMIDEEDIMMMNPHAINQYVAEKSQDQEDQCPADDASATAEAAEDVSGFTRAGDYKLELLEPTASPSEFIVLEQSLQK